jgi:acetyl-CoA acetyltransferase
MDRTVQVGGVGMVPSARPGRSGTYDVMGEAAVREALLDAWIPYHRVQQAFAGYVCGEPTSGQAVLDRIGLSGIPIVNVNDDGASGSSALWLACRAVASGAADCVLAVGFEETRPGSPQVSGPRTRLQCSPPTCGAAAVVLCSEGFARRHGIDDRVVIRARERATDGSGPFGGPDMMTLADGGRAVTNPSGGPPSEGHPLGVTGLAQCVELIWQLRERAPVRHVEGAGWHSSTA